MKQQLIDRQVAETAWPAAVLAGLLLFVTHNYLFFTTIHISSIAVMLAFAPLAPKRAVAGAAITVAILLSVLVGLWVAAYLVNEPCALRTASHAYGDHVILVTVGHVIEHCVLAGLVLFYAHPAVPLSPTAGTALLPVTAFVAYASYGRPCQIYPIDAAPTRVVAIGGLGLILYLAAIAGWRATATRFQSKVI